MQNRTHAIMAQRHEAADSPDDFPTPPWATRALLEHILGGRQKLAEAVCCEPACGEGHMAKVLTEYFGEVVATDKYDYGYGRVADFLADIPEHNEFDWIITNPPFRLAEEFVVKSLGIAHKGVAILVRTVFIESIGRYQRLFSMTAPTKFVQFSERVPMVKGRLDAKASTATAYCWLVWEVGNHSQPALFWIPPCREQLERAGDYGLPVKS
jgi:hypothetical protein